MELEDPVCYCFHISKRKVLNYIRQHPPRVASELSQCGGAGTGCGWCIPYLKRYFEQSRTGGDLADAISKEQYARDRAAYIKAGKGTPAAGAIPLPDGESP
jgi:bacterioferritin-associated ferredoxin